MKSRLQIILFILIGLNSFGQDIGNFLYPLNLELPNDSTLYSNSIIRIEAKHYSPDSTSNISEVWLIDSNGFVIKYYEVDTERAITSSTSYEYKNQKKAKIYKEIRNIKGVIDSALKTYKYDSNGTLQEIESKGTIVYKTKRFYKENKILYDIKTDTNIFGEVFIDSIFYNRNNQPVRWVLSRQKVFWLWKYNIEGKLQSKILYESDDTTLIFQKYILNYENRKLIYEEQYFSNTGKEEQRIKSEYRYFYNSNGLVMKVEELIDDNFILYREYKYYKE